VEDEPLLAKQLKKMLEETEPSIRQFYITHSVEETVSLLQSKPAIDLSFMDIELADGQSFEIFKKTTVPSPVIFITAYNEFALKAFKLNSIDYLLKPVNREELQSALHKFKKSAATSYLLAEQIDTLFTEIHKLQQLSYGYKDRFLIRMGSKMISIDAGTIAYFFSEGGVSYIRTADNQKYTLDHPLDEIDRMLNPKKFFRANRKYLLAHTAVVAIRQWFNQKLIVEVKPATEEHIVVSREKSQHFKAWLGE
jgi:two-component system LytT family response regulator